MFDLKDKNKIKILENGNRVVDKLESGKCIYIYNTRTEEKYKLLFKKVNGFCYKVLFEFINKDNELDNKEIKVSTKSNLGVLVHNRITISMIIEDSKLILICPEEYIFYE